MAFWAMMLSARVRVPVRAWRKFLLWFLEWGETGVLDRVWLDAEDDVCSICGLDTVFVRLDSTSTKVRVGGDGIGANSISCGYKCATKARKHPPYIHFPYPLLHIA